MNELDPRIEAALESYPITPLPRGFVRRTMAQIEPSSPSFRLDFLDVAIPLFLALFILTMGVIAMLILRTADPLWVLEIQLYLQLLVLRASTLSRSLIGALIILSAGTATCVGLLIMGLWIERETSTIRRMI